MVNAGDQRDAAARWVLDDQQLPERLSAIESLLTAPGDEMGDLLFAVVGLARKLKVNPEDALRVAGQRFRKRFSELEATAAKEGLELKQLQPDDLLTRWERTS